MNCHEATRTMSDAQEHKLALGQKVSLQLHLAICSKCRQFEQQVVFLRESMLRGTDAAWTAAIEYRARLLKT